MSDSFDLQRFVDAQASIYRQVVEELSRGRKQTHWMWFIFPQIAGLGFSAMAQRFAIGSHAEAVAYLEHDLLGPRLVECTRLVMAASEKPVASSSSLLILRCGLIKDFVASPGEVILCLDVEAPFARRSRDEKLTPDTEVDHGETVSVQNSYRQPPAPS